MNLSNQRKVEKIIIENNLTCMNRSLKNHGTLLKT